MAGRWGEIRIVPVLYILLPRPWAAGKKKWTPKPDCLSVTLKSLARVQAEAMASGSHDARK